MTWMKEAREQKIEACGKKVTGLRALFSFWAPALFFLSVFSVWEYCANWDDGSAAAFIVQLITGVLSFCVWLFGRVWDKTYWALAVSLIAVLAVSHTWEFISLVASAASLHNAVMDTAAGTGNSIVVGFAGSISSIGTSVVFVAALFGFLLYLFFVVFYACMLFGRRGIFFVDNIREDE